MTSEAQGSTHVPRGFKTYTVGKQLVIQCPNCKRRWKADRIVNQRNQTFLYEHMDDHKHTRALTAFQLGIPPDD